jgi:hypothetical protein
MFWEKRSKGAKEQKMKGTREQRKKYKFFMVECGMIDHTKVFGFRGVGNHPIG